MCSVASGLAGLDTYHFCTTQLSAQLMHSVELSLRELLIGLGWLSFVRDSFSNVPPFAHGLIRRLQADFSGFLVGIRKRVLISHHRLRC